MQFFVGNNEHIKMKPYRTPTKNSEIIDKAINEILGANIIRRARSPWSFPIVIVDKKDGSKRFSFDYRKLNQILRKSLFRYLLLTVSWHYLVKLIIHLVGLEKWLLASCRG